LTYAEIAARLKEADIDDPVWFMAVQFATDEMENMKLRELAEIIYYGQPALKGIKEEDFMEWVKEEAEAWDLEVSDWLNEVAPRKKFND
jgi:hypothetical protein